MRLETHKDKTATLMVLIKHDVLFKFIIIGYFIWVVLLFFRNYPGYFWYIDLLDLKAVKIFTLLEACNIPSIILDVFTQYMLYNNVHSKTYAYVSFAQILMFKY